MVKYVGLLRGINVSGQKKIKMDELRASLAQLGYQNIQTYIQSGNLIFESDKTDQKQLQFEIHQNILDTFGFDVPVLIRSETEWHKTFETNPFINDRNEDITKLHVAMLAEEPAKENLETLNNYECTPEEFAKVGLNIYLFCPNGYGRSNIDNNILERKLKVPATTRNWKTVTKLMEMLKGQSK